jgi:glycosyltransferase involved in cell wall biosynthesis
MKFLIIAGSGIGGTEKAAFLFAEALLKRGHEVVALTKSGQPRTTNFEAVGGLIIDIDYTQEQIERLLTEQSFDIIHQHVSGYGDQRPLYNALDKIVSERPRLIETNVFGQLLDFDDNKHVDMRMFVSYTSGLQAFMRTRRLHSKPSINRHTVLFNPLVVDAINQPTCRIEIRRSIGVSVDEFLAIRIGRPSHKWTNWECKVFKSARIKNQKIRLLLMEPSSDILSGINANRYGEGIIVKTATSDNEIISQLYQAADVMIHASSFGESFGYTIAEAMVARLPIITLSTPWGDNAQTELINHGKTGFICCSLKGMTDALLQLSINQEQCRGMGNEGFKHIKSIASLENEVGYLEAICEYMVTGDITNDIYHRYNNWKNFAKNRLNISLYERDNSMWYSLFKGKCYAAIRHIKTLKRYFLLRFKGYSVSLPTTAFRIFID